MFDKKLAGKIAVVTGGGSGIGQSISVRFAQEAAQVIVLDISQERADDTQKKINDFGGKVSAYVCDVSAHDQVNKTIESICDQHQRIDILVNNAGIAHVGNLRNTSEDDLDRLYRVNVKGVYNCMYAVIDNMVVHGGGVILNLASIASKIGMLDRFAYSMSKGAVLTMTLSVARDYVDKSVRCNCICPARVHTPFVDNFIALNYPGQEEKLFKQLSEYQPMGRMGKPDEIANLTLFLCSDEAAFITGSAYDIDGGVTNLR